ncbi:MAG: M28 family peptidase [Verrucomicrobiaceae bacterium]|nr:M28 family peptidase [Verrucomicrobiaceae bacterium]
MRIRDVSRLKSGDSSAEIQKRFATLDVSQLRRWIEHISIPRHFTANATTNAAIAEWIASELDGLGYQTQFQGRYRNVIASSPLNADKVIVVGAHYDSVPETPGADDNGSAVAAMLGCAHLCSTYHPDLPVVFVAFNCEEDGLLGSSDWVAQYLPKAGYDVECAHVLEMVGFADNTPGSQKVPPGPPISLPDRGDFIGLLTNRNGSAAMKSALQTIRTEVPRLPAYGVEVLLGLEKYFPVLHRSDHAPFWKAGIPSIMWTDTSEFRNPHYHASSDTPDTLNYDFLKQVTQAVTAVVLTQAAALENL